MLILTTSALPDRSDLSAVALWHGPRVLIVPPGSGLSQAAVRDLTRDFIVVEHLQPIEGVAARLVDVMRWVPFLLAEGEGPLLYLDRPADADFVAGQAVLGRSMAHEVATEFAGDGRMVMLRLGEMVATSPLMPAFMAFLAERRVEDARLADLIGTTFAGIYA